MKIVVIDGQGGKLGRMLIEEIKKANLRCEVFAIGTNSIATSAMLKGGADSGATGENPVIVACRDADVVIGPIGIIVTDALYGEITPTMAEAVGKCYGIRLLLPVNLCRNRIIGIQTQTFSSLVISTVDELRKIIESHS